MEQSRFEFKRRFESPIQSRDRRLIGYDHLLLFKCSYVACSLGHGCCVVASVFGVVQSISNASERLFLLFSIKNSQAKQLCNALPARGSQPFSILRVTSTSSLLSSPIHRPFSMSSKDAEKPPAKGQRKGEPGAFSWVMPALRSRRTLKTWIRCCIVLAATLVLMVSRRTSDTMGQASFFCV